MPEPITDSDLELLKQKHGHEPLINLIRMLVVAVDQTDVGSEEREKTVQLLKFLTKQDNIAPNSSSWLDWLESVGDNELSWDDLSISPSSTSKRRVVEIEDDLPSGERPRLQPMSKEQMIWAKALERQENKGSIKSYLSKLLLLVILVSFVYAIYAYGPMIKEELHKFKQPSIAHSVDVITPMDLWGNYQSELFEPEFLDPRQKEISLDFLNSIEQQNLPLIARDWISSKQSHSKIDSKELASIYWLGLRELEHRFFGSHSSPNDLNQWNKLSPGNRHWSFKRFKNDKELYQGNFIENFTKTSQGWDIQIKKIIQKNGIAHRVILDSNGLYAWTWRLLWQGQTLEGRVLREKPGQFKISTTRAWSELIEFRTQYYNLNHIPAIWTPSFFEVQPEAMIFPISGQECKGSIFWADNQIFPTSQGFQLKSARENWYENWTLMP